MSASLVGSEMCIRDSPHAMAPVRGRPRESSEGPLSGAVGLSLEEGPETVSYTHLTLPTICSV
eukprot:7637812-Alexandrium_andersonii.AAC.1